MLVPLVIVLMTFFPLERGIALTVQRTEDSEESRWFCVGGSSCLLQPTGGRSGGHVTQDTCKLTCGAWGPLWPRPTSTFQLSTELLDVDVSEVSFTLSQQPLLEEVKRIFQQQLSLLACGDSTCPACEARHCLPLAVAVTVTNPEVEGVEWGVDESYSLQVASEAGAMLAQISAPTVFGARHGLQTLAQLMARGRGGGHVLMLSSAAISNDTPKFTHRGVMLDTSRHFFPISTLERTVEAMATCKLNTLHLHLTDSHSFPFRSELVPQLSRYGAYSANEIYTPQQLTSLSQFALARGVRIIPELDAPAHAGNGWEWGPEAGLGELAVCVNRQPWRQFCIQPPCGQLNPANPNVYQILGKVYGELEAALRPHARSVFHMGGDEVVVPCWRDSEGLNAWLAAQPGHEGLTDSDYHWAWEYFQGEALRHLDMAYNGSQPDIIVWSSALTEPGKIQQVLDPARYVVQTWVPENETLVQDLLNLGYRVIVSNKDAWYLDWGFWGRHLYSTWKRVYEARLPPAALGGEVALWTELVDEITVDSLLWPRGAALAERLWSDPPPNERATSAEGRLLQWRRRAVETLGIRAASVTPQWCELQEADCY